MIYIRSIYSHGKIEKFTEARHVYVLHATKNKDGFLEAIDTSYYTLPETLKLHEKITQSVNTSLAVIQLYNSAGTCIRGYKSGVVIDALGEENFLYILVEEG
jgi:hypothetical protein